MDKQRGRPKKLSGPTFRAGVSLDFNTHRMALAIGGGNISQGIRKMANIMVELESQYPDVYKEIANKVEVKKLETEAEQEARSHGLKLGTFQQLEEKGYQLGPGVVVLEQDEEVFIDFETGANLEQFVGSYDDEGMPITKESVKRAKWRDS